MNILKTLKLVFLFGVFMCQGTDIQAQNTNPVFPKMYTEDLDGNKILLPDLSSGKFTLLGMAYSRKAEAELQTWLNPIYNKFIAQTGMFDSFYDIQVFFIPIFTGANQGAFATSIKQAKAKTDKELKSHVLFYKGDIEEYKDLLDMERGAPVFIILDKEGKIVWRTSGSFSEQKMEEIENIVSE